MNTFIKYLLLPFLTFLIILVFISSNLKDYKSARKKNKENVGITQEELVKEESVKYDKLVNSGNSNFVFPADNIRDPFKKVIPIRNQPQAKYVLENELPIKLSGIIKGKDSPIAIIKTKNSSYVAKAGEKINDIQILSVQEKSIKIMRNGKVEYIQLWIDK